MSAIKFAPGSASRLIASCWDKNVYLYEIDDEGDHAEGTLVKKIPHRGPVLDVCFGNDETEAYSGGLDCTVQRSVLLQAVFNGYVRLQRC